MKVIFYFFCVLLVVLSGRDYWLYIILTSSYFIILWKIGFANDFKRPVDLFNLFYFIFIIIGSYVFFLIRGFGSEIAYHFSLFFSVFNLIVSFFIRPKAVTRVPIVRRMSSFSVVVCHLFLVFSAVMSILYYMKIGNIPLFSDASPEMRIAAMQGNGVYLQVIRYSVYVAMILALLSNKKIYFLIFLLSEIVLLGVGFRGVVAQNMVILVISYFVIHDMKLGVSRVIFYGGIAFSSLLFIGIIRGDAGFSDNVFVKLGHMISVSVYNFSVIKDFFSDFQYGVTFIYNFKTLYPGPDIDFTQWLTTQTPIKFEGGITPTIVGDMYINFGKFFFVGAPVLAMILSMLQNKMVSVDIRRNVFYVLIIVNASVLIARSVTGGISNQTLNLFLTTIFLFSIFFVSRVKLIKRRGSSSLVQRVG